MPAPNFNLAPYCYLTHNASGGYDLSVVVPHEAGFTVTFPGTPDNSDYKNTEVLKIGYTIATSNATNLFSSKVYTNVFALATATKKIVKVFTNFASREYFTIQEDDDATDTLAMSGNLAPNCPHVYLPYILLDGTDNPKGLIPFDDMDFDTNPEDIVVSAANLTDTVSIISASTSGVVVKMLTTLAGQALPVSGGNPGAISLSAGSGTPTTVKSIAKRKNHNTHPGFRFELKSAADS